MFFNHLTVYGRKKIIGDVKMEDWKNEKLESGNFVRFEGKEGSAVLKFLTEQPEIFEKTFEGNSKPSLRAKWLVVDERDGEEKFYEIGKGGENSVYGRLQAIAVKNGGIQDVRVLFKWRGEGKARSYWVELASEAEQQQPLPQKLGGSS